MKRFICTAVLSGMIIPATASATISYDSAELGYSTTSFSDNTQLLKFDLEVSRSIFSQVFIDVAYGKGRQLMFTTTTPGVRTVSSASVGAGYHSPLGNSFDAVVKCNYLQGSSQFLGSSVSTNGYDLSAGIRMQVLPAEIALAKVYEKTSAGLRTDSISYFNLQLGFIFIPQFQLILEGDFRPDIKTSMILRLNY